MTFEEFFIKKKIDLTQLMRAKPDLYDEFRRHYVQMGEKSFDHTKKYWFNKLRKEYLLEDEQPVATKPTAVPNPAETKKDSSVTAAKPVGFKPRFKPNVAKPSITPEQTEDTPAEETPKTAPKPTGFKPRFKPGVTAAAKPAAETQNSPEHKVDVDKQSTEQTSPPSKPPGFKPRFKAGVTPTTKPIEEQPDSSENKEKAGKPLGFKPRFKAGSTGPKKDKPEKEGD